MSNYKRQIPYKLGIFLSKFSKIVDFINYTHLLIYSGYTGAKFKTTGTNLTVIPSLLLLRGAQFISLGNDVWIGKGVQLIATSKSSTSQQLSPEISVGNNCSIGDYSHITAINHIKLGNNVRMGKNVLITDNSHGSTVNVDDLAPNKRPLQSKGAIIIEDNVWIGEKTCILPGVTIGKNAIIGAGSVVTKDIPSNCIAAGNPAKVIRYLILNSHAD